MMIDLFVRHPRGREPERRYVYEQVMVDWLGLTLHCCTEDRDDVLLESSGSVGGPHVRVSDSFLALPSSHWLHAVSLPTMEPVPLQYAREFAADSLEEDVLLPWGTTGVDSSVRYSEEGSIEIGADIFGAIFFFLTRYEEVASPAADRFGRYPASSSWQVQHNLVERPLVDEYLAFLRAVFQRVWPTLAMRPSCHRVLVSHDVDIPLRYRWSPAARTLAGGLRDWRQAGGWSGLSRRMTDWYSVHHRGNYDRDPYNTFSELIACSEKWGTPSAFYFMASRTCRERDGLYVLDDPFILDLLRHLWTCGQEIGLHPSFETWLDGVQMLRERQRLEQVCEQQSIRLLALGGRQHYLRWRAPITWCHWESAGMAYDSTVGFAERAGFRAATAHEYHAFDLVGSRRLSLIERPLILMDATLLNYMKLGVGDEAIDCGLRLKRRCERLGGNFTILWHNSNLTSPDLWRLFTTIVEA